MTKTEIMKQLEAAVDEAIASRMYGLMKISWRDGEPEMLRVESTRKLNEGGRCEQNQVSRNRLR